MVPYQGKSLVQGCPTFLTGGPSVQILTSRGPV